MMILDDFFWRAVIAGMGVAILAGPLGCFVIWRRMSYLGDTMAHSALLGVALGIFLEVDLIFGVFVVAIAVAMILFIFQRQKQLANDAVLGTLSHASLAMGVLAISLMSWVHVDLMGYLFGDILAVDLFDLYWIYGGGPIAPETVKKLVKAYRSDRFYQVYGMTETGPTGTVLLPEDHMEHAGSIGRKALPGAEMKVMKDQTTQAGPGETGEIWLRADSMMKEYLNRPKATQEAFHEGWYKTGDMARIDEHGFLFIVDRIKDMIVTGGENVYSKEVEDRIMEHPDVAEAAVIGVPHTDWGETVHAVVVPAKGAEPVEKDLLAFLSDRLAKFKIPRKIHFTDQLPHTPSGKIMKFKIREDFTRV
jgi:hypothetical protein